MPDATRPPLPRRPVRLRPPQAAPARPGRRTVPELLAAIDAVLAAQPRLRQATTPGAAVLAQEWGVRYPGHPAVRSLPGHAHAARQVDAMRAMGASCELVARGVLTGPWAPPLP